MNKATRLLQILTILSARRLAVRGETLAEMLDVSLRTIYRDIEALRVAGAEIEGEAGIGFRLARRSTLPPLHFTSDELMALLVGERLVQAFTDAELAQAAENAKNKILSVLSEGKKAEAENLTYFAPLMPENLELRSSHQALRKAIETREKLQIHYQDGEAHQTIRVIWPLGLVAWIGCWVVVAWCTLREDYRSFRVDRIENIIALSEHFPNAPKPSLQDFLKNQIDDICQY